jgi:hypothetical protein
MNSFRNRELRSLERRLRAERPQPPSALMARLAPARPRTRPQLALAAGLTAALLVALASVGGVSYAATAVTHAVKVAAKAVTPAKSHQAIVVQGISAGGDQYQPGYGFGDKNHNHTGPPGVTRAGGEKAPPLQAAPTADGKAGVVTASVNFDEQAHLFISVVDSSGTPLLLTQQSKRGGSSVGGNAVGGPQTKFIQYAVLVPRTIPLQLRIPDNLLVAGQLYRIRIVAIDPDGNKTTLLIPFRAA